MVSIDKNLYYTPKVHVLVAYPTLKSVNTWLEHGYYIGSMKYDELRSKDILIKLFEAEKGIGSVCYCITKKCFFVLMSNDIEKLNLQKDGG